MDHREANRLVIVTGAEGAGKSTIIRALLPHTPYGARIDAEDIGQTNPCVMDDEFLDLIDEDRTIREATDADYRYVRIDTADLDVAETVHRIKGAIPDVYAPSASSIVDL